MSRHHESNERRGSRGGAWVVGFALSFACLACPGKGGDDGKGDGKITPGQASVALEHKRDAGTKREYTFVRVSGFDGASPTKVAQSVVVTYAEGGKADVTVDGTPAGTFAVSNTGDFDITADEGEVPPALHLLAIGDTPPPATTKVGDTWQTIEPPDGEVDSAALNVQTRLTYTVTAVDPGKSVTLDVVGDLRFVDTPGGRDLIKQLFPAAESPGTGLKDTTSLLDDLIATYTTFRPYLKYEATFDLAEGGVSAYSGVSVFDITGRVELDELATDSRRHEFELKWK